MDMTLGSLILAPRPRYSIEEVDYIPQLNASAGASGCSDCTTGMIKNWEIVFKVHCIGNGDLSAARKSYSALEKFLNDVCSSSLKKFSRSYCGEDPTEYLIDRGYIKPINLDWLPNCCDNTTLSGEVHLFSADIDAGAEFMLYNYVILKPTS